MSISFLLAAVIFPLSEIILSIMKRSKKETSTIEDNGTMKLLWLVIGISVLLAIAGQWIVLPQLLLPVAISHILAIIFLVSGLCIRWASIITLGRMFTTNVAVQNNHKLVSRGLYAYVRHPSYAGLLLEFIGLGFFFAHVVSLIVLLVPITVALIIRIKSEEAVLIKALGTSYVEYASKTKRLIPGIW